MIPKEKTGRPPDKWEYDRPTPQQQDALIAESLKEWRPTLEERLIPDNTDPDVRVIYHPGRDRHTVRKKKKFTFIEGSDHTECQLVSLPEDEDHPIYYCGKSPK